MSITIKARPSGYWNNTGVSFQTGERVRIERVAGSWKCNPYWGPVDGAGSSEHTAGSGYLCPGAPEGSLVGKVGGSNSGGGSAPFFVGNDGKIPADLPDGVLWLSVNDSRNPDGFGDNSGSLRVRITRQADGVSTVLAGDSAEATEGAG